MVNPCKISRCRSNIVSNIVPKIHKHLTQICKLSQHEGVTGPCYKPILPESRDWSLFAAGHTLWCPSMSSRNQAYRIWYVKPENVNRASAQVFLIGNRFMWTIAFILMNEQSCFRANGFKLCNATFIVFNKMCPFWHSLPEYPSSTFLYGSMVLIPGATWAQEANWK
jgi:hypothetical protein